MIATGGIGPYTYAIIAGSLPPGLTFNTSTGVISGIPTGQGTFSVTIEATDVNGDIGSRAYATFQVRPNPATDPDVIGLVAAQAATARRLASTQVTNVTSHLEDLHDAFDPCLLNIGFGASVINQPSLLPGSPFNANPTPPPASLPGTCAGRLATQFPLAFWTGGTLQFGSTDLGGSNNQFTTGGLTFGVDGRISNALIVGVAVGYGSEQYRYRHRRHEPRRAKFRRDVLCELSAVRSLVPRCGRRLRLARTSTISVSESFDCFDARPAIAGNASGSARSRRARISKPAR